MLSKEDHLTPCVARKKPYETIVDYTRTLAARSVLEACYEWFHTLTLKDQSFSSMCREGVVREGRDGGRSLCQWRRLLLISYR